MRRVEVPYPARVALVGYGLAGRVFHAPLVASTPGLALTTVVSADPTRRAQARAELPRAELLSHPDELWAAAEHHDIVVIASATGSHLALASAALAVGLPAVVEKPLAPTAAGARGLAAAADAAGVPVVPFHNRRWDADQLTLRRVLAAGELGVPQRYESRFERWRPVPDRGAWREVQPAAAGGGVLLDLGIHLVDQALTLFGPATTVYGEVASRRGGADDDVFVALEHGGGAVSHLWASAVAGAPGPRLRVQGSGGAFVVASLDGQEAELRAGRRPGDAGFGSVPPERWGRLVRGDEEAAVPSEPGRWSVFYAGVAAMVHEGAPAPVALADAVAAVAVLDAARHSAERREVVHLAPPPDGAARGTGGS